MNKILLSILLVNIGVAFSHAQERVFSEAQLKEDFQFLKESFDTYNPSIGIYTSKARFDRAYDSLAATINGEMTDLEFLPLLVRLAETTKEGHTIVGSNRDTINTIFKGFRNGSFKYLPFSFAATHDKVVLSGNFSPDSTLQIGDEIVAFNGQPIEHVVKEMMKYQIVDGNINAVKRSKALSSFASHYFWFIDQPSSFEIVGKADDKEVTVNIPAINRDSMIVWRDKRYGKPTSDKKPSVDDVYEFNISGNTATLTLKTFNRQLMEKYKIKPRKLYKDIFKQLKEQGIENLIIDLRDNSGGRKEYALEILPYVMNKEYSGSIYKTISWKGKERKTRFPKRSKWAFDGKLYVLTNENSFSNGSVVAVYAKAFGNATVIGRETASRFEGFAAGSRQVVNLPNSKILVRIPRYVYVCENEWQQQNVQNRGLIPDYEINYSVEDLIEKRDKEMEKTRQLIEQGSN